MFGGVWGSGLGVLCRILLGVHGGLEASKVPSTNMNP